MWWAAWYAATIASSFVWLTGSAAGARLSLGELLSGSVALGTIAGAWFVFLAACAVGTLCFQSIALGTGFMVWLAFLNRGAFYREVGRILLHAAPPAAAGAMPRGGAASARSLSCALLSRLRLPLTPADWVCLALVTGLGLYLFPLYSTRMIPEVHGMLWSGGSCYGDLPIHMQISNAFIHGCNMQISWSGMKSPIFAGERMTYPFLPDFHAAIVVAAGGTLRQGFLWPGFFMASALWALLFYFSLRVSRSALGASMSVLLTLFAGGLGGPRWVRERGWAEASRSDVVQHDWTGEWKHLWFAFVPHILLPQRGGNFAYPLVAFILILLLAATEPLAVPHPPLPHMLTGRPRALSSWDRAAILRYAALFTGALPMVQAHSFIGLGVVVAVIAIFDAHKWLADPVLLWAGWAAAGVIALATGGPQMILFRKTVSEGFYGSFMQYGWLFKKDLYLDFGTPHNAIGFLRFWWHSLGPTVPLFLLGTLLFAVEACVAARHAVRLSRGTRPGEDDAVASHVRSQQERALFSAADCGAGGAGGNRGAASFFVLRADVDAQMAGGMDGDGDSDSPPHRSSSGKYAFKSALSPRSSAASATASGGLASGVGSPLSGTGGFNGGVGGGSAGAGGWLSSGAWAAAAGRAAASGRDWVKARPWLTAGDRALSPLNSLSVAHGRALDLFKLCIGGFSVFLLGNYVNFQPWDRDNAKLYYIFIFVASAVNGGLLAAPVEAALNFGPGRDRLWVWLTLSPTPRQEQRDFTGGRASSGSSLSARDGGEDEGGADGRSGTPPPPADSGAPRLTLASRGGGGPAASPMGGGTPTPSAPRTPSRTGLPPLHLGGVPPLTPSGTSDYSDGSSASSAVRSSPSASGMRMRTTAGGADAGSAGAGGGLSPRLSTLSGTEQGNSAPQQRSSQQTCDSPSKARAPLEAPHTACTVPIGVAAFLGMAALPLLLYLSMLSGYILLSQEAAHWSPMFDYDSM